MQGIEEKTKYMWKNFWLTFFLCNLIWEKNRREKQLKEASVSGEDWCEVQKKKIGIDGILLKKKKKVFSWSASYRLNSKWE